MGKKYNEVLNKVDTNKEYTIDEAIDILKTSSFVKFDESVDFALKLGVDPRKSDQMVRGYVVLPHGTGKKVRVMVFAKGEKEMEAKEAGADYIGAEDFVEKIQKGWLEFDKAVATPDVMGLVGRLGKILGPRGLMPNPKTGTVTFELARAIKEIKAGKVDFRVEKTGIIHMSVGKVSFEKGMLIDNAKNALESIVKLKPPTSKGRYLRKLVLSSTMGPGLKVDLVTVTPSRI